MYGEALEQLAAELQRAGRLEDIDGEQLEHAVARAWGHLAPATWNRNLAVLKSSVRWRLRDDELAWRLTRHIRRRREAVDPTRESPTRRWSGCGAARQCRCARRRCGDCCMRPQGASEILALDIKDLDLAHKRARIRSKGGDLDHVYLQSGSARLLPRLLAGRTRGPVFLTGRHAPAGTPTVDTCPVTGRARLSYRRAAAVFAHNSGGLALHQLRHSALTDLAEAGESTVLLMAKSRHRSLRSLQRYTRPGPEAVAALTARRDPARRRA